MQIRLAVPILVLCLLVMTGCGDDDPQTGEVRVWLTDAPYPFDMIEDATILIEDVVVRVAADDDGASGWYDIDHTPQEYHLLDLQQGVAAVLGGASVPLGQITQFRVTISEASITLKDGRMFDLQVPSGASSGLKVFPDPPLQVSSELTAEVLLDADVSMSFKSLPASPQRVEDITGFQFTPVLRAANMTSTGSIAGTVYSDEGTPEIEDDLPLEGATVMAYAAGDTMVTSTDALGSYEIMGLDAGSYSVEGSKLGFISGSLAATVVAGNRSTGNDLRLTPQP